MEQNPVGSDQLENSRREYQEELLTGLFDFTKLQGKIFYCIRKIKDASNILINSPIEKFYEMNRSFKEDIIDISQKFKVQLFDLFELDHNIENNSRLQLRLKKAGAYFIEKLEKNVIKVLQETDIETDNKKVRKEIKDVLHSLGQETHVKIVCLRSCLNGFSLKTYLNNRAKAALDNIILKKAPAPRTKIKESVSSDHPELFTRLKEWRNKKAQESDIPHFMILHQKTLYEITKRLPSTMKQLKDVYGLGKRKIKQYGEEIIEIINEYCSEKDIKIERTETSYSLPEIESKSKQKKPDTKKISLDLFKEGKTIGEIATARGLVISTIEGHLGYFVRIRELDINKLVSKEKIAMISEYFQKHDFTTLSEAKAALGGDVSWGELKLVLAHVQAHKQTGL
jgi:uncharacterized protein YpbB